MKQLIKIAFSLGLLLVSGTAAAKCMDLRTVRISPCPEGRMWVPVRGLCTETYQAETLFCAVEAAPECYDRRVEFWSQPCPEGKERVYFQGRCEKGYQYEHAYCEVR